MTGLGSGGMSAPATLVHLKFSTQPPCIWSRSNWSAAAVVLGALYQLWNSTCTRSGRGWQIHSRMNPVTGALPPCPLTTAIRRKPCPARPSSRSLSTSMYVVIRRLMLPGKAAK